MKVDVLINDEFKYWREPFVRSLFPAAVVPHTLGIHIPENMRSDTIIWPKTKSGSYSVKSGYFAAHIARNPTVTGFQD